MVCKSVEEFVDNYLNKDIPFSKISFENDSMYNELIEYCEKNGKNDCRLFNIVGIVYSNVYKDEEKAIPYLTQSANLGYERAQCNLGKLYKYGIGVLQDNKKAVYWYTKAANQGNSDAQCSLALMYYNGEGVEKDYTKALELYTKAANQGNASAQNNLALMYYNGEGVDQDYSKALELFTKSAKQCLAAAQYNLASMFHNGEGIDKDYAKALDLYTKAAEQGNASAQKNLAFMYYNGEGVEKDYTKALELYTNASEQGNSDAQNNLALMYENGEGVERDYGKALDLYTKAADQGNVTAQYNLAVIYDNGEIAPQDYGKALELYTKAANQGNALAQNNLALMYENGKGVDQDYTKALELFKKSAEGGNHIGYRNLGDAYLKGTGVEKDYDNARKCFEKAIEIDESYSLPYYDLGNMYYYGEGVEKDLNKAIKYFSKSNELGDPCDFILNLAKIENGTLEYKNYALEYANEYKMVKFDFFVDKVKESFGDNWNKLDDKTKDFIEKSIKIYDFFVDQGMDGDYSSVALELIKGLENEIKYYFVDKYFEYLEKNNQIGNIKNKNIINKEQNVFNPDLVDRFTLGDFEKLLGKREINVESAMVMGDRSLNERKRSANDSNKSVTFDKLLVKYVKSELFNMDKFGYNEDEEIVDYLIYFYYQVHEISSKYRNPAAHRGDISKIDAEFIINCLLFKEKLFVNFMDKIKG